MSFINHNIHWINLTDLNWVLCFLLSDALSNMHIVTVLGPVPSQAPHRGQHGGFLGPVPVPCQCCRPCSSPRSWTCHRPCTNPSPRHCSSPMLCSSPRYTAVWEYHLSHLFLCPVSVPLCSLFVYFAMCFLFTFTPVLHLLFPFLSCWLCSSVFSFILDSWSHLNPCFFCFGCKMYASMFLCLQDYWAFVQHFHLSSFLTIACSLPACAFVLFRVLLLA